MEDPNTTMPEAEVAANERIMMDRTRVQAIPQSHSLRGAFAIVPEDHRMLGLEDLQLRPNRVRAHRTVTDARSFVAYLNHFALDHSIMVSSVKSARITALIDYHEESGLPNHCDHQITMSLNLSPEYAAWKKLADRGLSQKEAGEFLEERAVDVVAPGPADIMEMVMKFDALKRVTFRQSTRLADGQRQFEYVEENEARGAVRLPEIITINIPVFDGMEPQRITVRVRYRINDGSLRFAFLIHDAQRVERDAFERIEDAVQVDLKKNLMLLRDG